MVGSLVFSCLSTIFAGFMESSDFLRMKKERNDRVELCGAGAIYRHTKNSNNRPYYYTDIVISAGNK